jgi:hypothetical protein
VYCSDLQALFSEDQQWYEAVIKSCKPDGKYLVEYTEYGNSVPAFTPPQFSYTYHTDFGILAVCCLSGSGSGIVDSWRQLIVALAQSQPISKSQSGSPQVHINYLFFNIMHVLSENSLIVQFWFNLLCVVTVVRVRRIALAASTKLNWKEWFGNAPRTLR